MNRFRIKLRGKTVRKFLCVTKIFNIMEITKQCIGIDVSKDSLDVIFKEQVNQEVKIKGSRKFYNNSDSFSQLIEWCNKREKCENVVYMIEATGIYHEDLLYFLYNSNKKVCVELPQRIKYFAKSKGVKTKNDKVDSSIIADYGIERQLRLWQPPSKEFKKLRDLSREHNSIQHLKTIAENRLHAAKRSHGKNQRTINRYIDQIAFYKDQLSEIEKDMKNVIKKDGEIKEKLNNITTIKGIGLITAVKIVSETGGFYLFSNIGQLVSYAGLDIVENQSGNHIGKTKISKKGNANLRTALYMPAMTSIQHDKKMKSFNDRIMQSHQIKKQGMVAVMRKLLVLTYTLWKKNEPYDENYIWNKAG